MNNLILLLRMFVNADYSIKFPSLTNKEWVSLMHLAELQGVSAIAYDSVNHLDKQQMPSLQVMMTWMKDDQEALLKWNKLCFVADKLKSWNNDDIVIFKGQNFAQKYYEKPYLRYSSDIDLINYPEDILAEYAERSTEEVDEKHSVYELDGITIENHSHLLSHCLGDVSDEERLLQNLIERKGKVDAEFYYSYLPLHIISHYISKGLSLRQLVDWYLFRKTDGSAFSGSKYAETLDDVCKALFVKETDLTGLAKDIYLFVTFRKLHIQRPIGMQMLRHPVVTFRYALQQAVKYKNLESRQRSYLWHCLLSKLLFGK